MLFYLNKKKFIHLLFLRRSSFTFKYHPDIYSNLDLKYLYTDVKFKQIIKIYISSSTIFNHHRKYVIENLSKFTNYDKEDLLVLVKIMVFLSKELSQNSQLKNYSDNSYVIHDKNYSDKYFSYRPKSIGNLFNCFYNMIENKSLKIEDYSNIYKSLKSVPGSHKKFQFILSKVVIKNIEKIIKERDLTYDFEYLTSNFNYLEHLSDLPDVNKIILNFINFILEGKDIKILPEKIIVYLNKYDQIKFYPNYKYLSCNYGDLVKKIKNIPLEEFNTLDENMSNMINDLYLFKKFSNINLIFDNLCGNEKLKIDEIKLLPKLISNSVNFMNDYFFINLKSNFVDCYHSMNSLIQFYSKYYQDLKCFLFTDNEYSKKCFMDVHNFLFKFFSQLNEIKIINDPMFLIGILDILSLNSLNNIKSSDCDKFLSKNFDYESISKNENFCNQSNLKKLILSYLNSNLYNRNEMIKYLINIYLKLYESVQQNMISYYFLDLNMIIYHCLINDFPYEETYINMVEHMLLMIKVFSFNESRFYLRLNLIIENLKIFKNGSVYKHDRIHDTLIEIEEVFNKIKISSSIFERRIWWDKDYMPINKYSVSDIRAVLLNNKYCRDQTQFQINSIFKNLFTCDFLLKSSNPTYIDIISPYHLVHTVDYNFITINNKYKRKNEIFKNYSTDLIYISHKDVFSILQDFKF